MFSEELKSCKGDCINRIPHHFHKPTEYIEKEGYPEGFPVWRVATLKLPMGGCSLESIRDILKLMPSDTKIIDVRTGFDYGQTVEFLLESRILT